MRNFDLEKLNEKLKSLSHSENIEWTRRIINTKMPLLAVKMPDLRNVVKEIQKEEILAYLDCETFAYYENTVVYAKLMTKLKKFRLMNILNLHLY